MKKIPFIFTIVIIAIFGFVIFIGKAEIKKTLKLKEVSTDVLVDGKLLSPVKYKAAKKALVEKIKKNEEVGNNEFQSILDIVMELCGGIKLYNYQGNGEDILIRFLDEGCFIYE